MTETPDLSQFPDFGSEVDEKLGLLPAPKPLLPPGIDPPECSFCDKLAVYLLDEIHLVVKTNEGAEHVVVSKVSSDKVIAACVEHKDGVRDAQIANGAHISVMNDTRVPSELVKYDVYWKMI